MNRVASELGAATMSLYRHLTAKDELLAHMVDTAYGDPPPTPGGETWRDGLAHWAAAHLAVLRRHAWLVRVPIGGPPLMPNQLRWFERGLSALTDTRLDEREKVSALLLVNGFVRNHATLEGDLLIAARTAGVAPEEAGHGYHAMLDRLADAERFPRIRALLDARVFAGDRPIDDDFQFGLERLLDGIGALVHTRAAR